MPKPNLPLGLYGLFVPAVAGDWTYTPNALWTVDPNVGVPGLYGKILTGAGTGTAILNMNQFLAWVGATSPNAPLGGQYGANVLSSFDVVYQTNSGAPTSITPAIFETQFPHSSASITPKSASNTPALVLTPTVLPPTGVVTGQTGVVNVSLADYYLLGQNLQDVMDLLTITVVNTAGVNFLLYGVQLYFGYK